MGSKEQCKKYSTLNEAYEERTAAALMVHMQVLHLICEN